MTTRKYPAYVARTAREWHTQKRREWRAIQRAVDEFRLGCAYTPVYPREVDVLDKVIRDGMRLLSVKEWGR